MHFVDTWVVSAFWTIMNKDFMNIHEQVFGGVISALLSIYLGVELLRPLVTLYLSF